MNEELEEFDPRPEKSPDQGKQLAVILLIMIFLTSLGAALLANKINQAEAKNNAILKAKK